MFDVNKILFSLSQHPRTEQFHSTDNLAGDHEHAVTRVVQRLGMLRRNGDIRFHHFKDEEVVFVDKRVVVQATLEAGMTLTDQRRPDLLSQWLDE